MRPKRRTTLKVLILLAAGATLNVAVAWGCAQYSAESFTLVRGHVLAMMEADWPVDGSLRYQSFRRGTSWARIDGYSGKDRLHVLVVLSVGWPCRSLHSWSQRDGQSLVESNWCIRLPDTPALGFGLPRQHELPLRPLWPGFAINTLFYAGVLWMLYAGPFALRRMIRRRRGQCPACGYPIGQSPVCTECGAAVTPTTNAVQS